MKKRILFAILTIMFLSNTTSFCQGLFSSSQNTVWIPKAAGILPSGPTLQFEVMDISIVDDTIIWASAIDWTYVITPPVASNHKPVVMKSIDGGENWDTIEVVEAIGRIIGQIHAFDEDTAWITTNNLEGSQGGDGLFKTMDGGDNWEVMLDHNAGGGWLYFFDSIHGVCGVHENIRTTSNGGGTWIPIASIPPFISSGTNASTSRSIISNTIWFGTSIGNVYKSTDKGHTWSIFSSNDTLGISSVAFIDEMDGLLVRGKGAISRSTDGGENWDSIDSPYAIFELVNIPGSQIIIGTNWEDGLTVCTEDLGDTWVQLDDIVSAYAPTFADITHGWVAAERPNAASPALYKWWGQDIHVAVNDLLDNSTRISVYPNPFLSQVNIQADDVEIETIRVLDTEGRVRAKFPRQHTSEISLDLFNLNQGIYFLEIRTSGGFITKKIVK